MTSKQPMDDPRTLWQGQPGERTPVSIEDLGRRNRRLLREARRDMVATMAAVASLLLLPRWVPAVQMGLWYDLAQSATAAWALLALLLLRKRLWPGLPPPAAVAVPGMEHFRAELARRRDHLRLAWLWRAPAVAALLLFVVSFASLALGQRGSIRPVLPLLAVSSVWVVLLAAQTLRQVRRLDAEIRRLDCQGSGV